MRMKGESGQQCEWEGGNFEKTVQDFKKRENMEISTPESLGATGNTKQPM